MNIFVCIKQVPETSQSVKIDPEGTAISLDGLEFVINPFDEYAIEEALRIKERFHEGKVTLVTMGPERCQKALRSGLAMGADDAVQLSDPLFDGSDPLTTARILAAFLKTQEFGLVLAGKQAVDDDSSMVPQALAEYLGVPHVCTVKKLELADDKKSATAHREIDGGTEVVTCRLPAVFSAEKGLNEPRYESLKGKMAAKKKQIRSVSAAELGLDPAKVGPRAATVKVCKLSYPEVKQGGVRMIEGDLAGQVAETTKILREGLKVI